jgi:hypothetical protein
VTRGRLQATNVASAERADHAPGSREVESILIAATALPFAGEAETGISVGCVMRKGLQPSENMASRRPWGARSVTEEGNLPALPHGTSMRGAGYLRSGRIDPYRAHRHCLDHPRRNRRWILGVASHAASRGAVAFDALPLGRLARPGDGIDGAVWLAACLSSKEGGLSQAA